MPDIRNILKGLDDADQRLYYQIRTRLRMAYIQALAEVVGTHNYHEHDDAFLDLIDIKVASLFDRGGRFDHSEGELDKAKEAEVEDHVVTEGDKVDAILNKPDPKPETSEASKSLKGWDSLKDLNGAVR